MPHVVHLFSKSISKLNDTFSLPVLHFRSTSGATAVPSLEFDRLFCCNCFGRRWRTAEHSPVTAIGMDQGRHVGGGQAYVEEPQVMLEQPDSNVIQRQ